MESQKTRIRRRFPRPDNHQAHRAHKPAATQANPSMKPKQEPFTPEELEPILNLASECGMILVGGQAVNSWALLLEKPEDEPWKSLRPYTSQDADMLCSEYQMLKFAKTLSDSGWGVQVFRAEGKEKTINVGAVRIRGVIGGKKRTVELNLLRQLQGISNAEIEEAKETIPIINHSIHVIDCLRMLESKTISLHSLDQSKRQDRKHLILCCAAVKAILKESSKMPSLDGPVATASRIVRNANSELGLDTLQHHSIDLLDAIPWMEWLESKQPELIAFAQEESSIRAGIQEKIQETKELVKWLKSLNPKNPGINRDSLNG